MSDSVPSTYLDYLHTTQPSPQSPTPIPTHHRRRLPRRARPRLIRTIHAGGVVYVGPFPSKEEAAAVQGLGVFLPVCFVGLLLMSGSTDRIELDLIDSHV